MIPFKCILVWKGKSSSNPPPRCCQLTLLLSIIKKSSPAVACGVSWDCQKGKPKVRLPKPIIIQCAIITHKSHNDRVSVGDLRIRVKKTRANSPKRGLSLYELYEIRWLRGKLLERSRSDASQASLEHTPLLAYSIPHPIVSPPWDECEHSQIPFNPCEHCIIQNPSLMKVTWRMCWQ